MTLDDSATYAIELAATIRSRVSEDSAGVWERPRRRTSGAGTNAQVLAASGKWQATSEPSRDSSGGSTSTHTGCAYGQRVRNLQPLGGESGLGGSPATDCDRVRPPRRAEGTAERRAAVYGCRGAANKRSVSATSTNFPRYMTAIRSLTWRTTEMSCEMKSSASPNSTRRSSIRFRICAWIDTSSADTGSSATTNRGFVTIARATPIR